MTRCKCGCGQKIRQLKLGEVVISAVSNSKRSVGDRLEVYEFTDYAIRFYNQESEDYVNIERLCTLKGVVQPKRNLPTWF